MRLLKNYKIYRQDAKTQRDTIFNDAKPLIGQLPLEAMDLMKQNGDGSIFHYWLVAMPPHESVK